MERRFYLGLAILALLLGLGLLSGVWVDRSNRQVVEYLEMAEEAARTGTREEALELTRKAERLWKKGWHRVAVIADHTAMDEIDGLFAQMEHYAREGSGLFGAGCARVRELVSAISDGHRLTWWNLL